MPRYFWDHHDAFIMRRDVMTIGSVPYHTRLEARTYYEARRNAAMKVAIDNRIQPVAPFDI